MKVALTAELLYWFSVLVFQVVTSRSLNARFCLMLSTRGWHISAQLQLRLQLRTDAAASETATVKTIFCAKLCENLHQLRREVCHRCFHAQVTTESPTVLLLQSQRVNALCHVPDVRSSAACVTLSDGAGQLHGATS